MALHAKLSASAAHRWMNCPASVRLSEGVPHVESPHASLGTMAHSVAAYCLKNRLPANAILDDHADSVQFYLDFCRAQPGNHAVEIDLAPALARIDPDTGGTADFVCWTEDGKHLLVADFKFGTGVPVAAEDNKQLKMYALGAMLSLYLQPETVEVAIVQPRLEDPEQWVKRNTFRAIDLLDFAADVQEAAVKARLPDAEPVPGEEQCRWCQAAKAKRCSVAVKTGYKKPAGARVTIDDFAVTTGP